MMWIDQCCINQSNNIEKGAQVQLMGEIYKAAERTTIWIGESDEHVFDVQELTKAVRDADSATGTPASDVVVMQDMIGTKEPRSEVCMRRLRSITSFLNHQGLGFSRSSLIQDSGNQVWRCRVSIWPLEAGG
jgi:hypothetical protein